MAGLGSACAVHAADVEAFAPNWPPYNYLEQGQVSGISSDVLRWICRDAGLSCTLHIEPWVRAYRTVQAEPSTLLYTTARTAEREHLFRWVGPLLSRETWLFMRAGLHFRLDHVHELAGFRIGVVRGDAAIADLLRLGFPEESLDYGLSEEANMRRLALGRLDAVTGTEISVRWMARTQGLPMSGLNRAMQLSNEGGYYFALNPDTPAALVVRLQKAMDHCRAVHCAERLLQTYVD